jgi:hypothetical protein
MHAEGEFGPLLHPPDKIPSSSQHTHTHTHHSLSHTRYAARPPPRRHAIAQEPSRGGGERKRDLRRPATGLGKFMPVGFKRGFSSGEWELRANVVCFYFYSGPDTDPSDCVALGKTLVFIVSRIQSTLETSYFLGALWYVLDDRRLGSAGGRGFVPAADFERRVSLQTSNVFLKGSVGWGLPGRHSYLQCDSN